MTQSLTDAIKILFQSVSINPVNAVELLPESGGDRTYFRIFFQNENQEKTCIATYGENVEENKKFIQLSKFFTSHDVPVPKILAVNDDYTLYIQEDGGNDSLLDVLKRKGFTDEVYALYKSALKHLVTMQTKGAELRLELPAFNSEAILHDLLYFKFYFADAIHLKYSKTTLLQELDQLAKDNAALQPCMFMFRDFQARNIVVKDDKVCFIDFQGGMFGHPAYDVASLLYQAKATLTDEVKEKLFEDYYQYFNAEFPIDKQVFKDAYKRMVFIRSIQTLGAYGFRGLYEKKTHFLSSIKPALTQLKTFLSDYDCSEFPELQDLLFQVTSESTIQKFSSIEASEESKLVVQINSFSFIKRGYPEERSGNGGGFVFDCRGILNPGRLEEFKTQTGRDKDVKSFLETKTQMGSFLKSIFNVVDVTIENYLERDFDHLTVSFGCTGGQHRSVYAADALDKHLREKYNVKTIVHHMEQPFSTNPTYD